MVLASVANLIDSAEFTGRSLFDAGPTQELFENGLVRVYQAEFCLACLHVYVLYIEY